MCRKTSALCSGVLSDKFFSEEDLDLKNLSKGELLKYREQWLRQAQRTNELDEHLYSHGLFLEVPKVAKTSTLEQDHFSKVRKY